MKRNYLKGCLLGLMLAALVVQLSAADKEGRVSGVVQMVSKDTSTITVREGSVPHAVVYSGDTKFTNRNKLGSIDDVKEGRRIICIGKFDDKGAKLMAIRVDVRTE
jgi:catabolite regulation protein CreA